MTQRVTAIFENGVFQVTGPLEIAEGQHVCLNVETDSVDGELGDVEDLLDIEFLKSCRRDNRDAPSLEEVREALGAFKGSLSDYISQERDER